MKRSPMPKRKKPMQKVMPWTKGKEIVFKSNSTFVRSSKRMRPLSKKKATSRAKWKRACLKRDKGNCVICAFLNPGTLVRAVEVHHHLPVGRGGKDVLENGLSTCRFHHDLIHTDPKWAHEWGYMLIYGEPMNEKAKKLVAFVAARKI